MDDFSNNAINFDTVMDAGFIERFNVCLVDREDE